MSGRGRCRGAASGKKCPGRNMLVLGKKQMGASGGGPGSLSNWCSSKDRGTDGIGRLKVLDPVRGGFNVRPGGVYSGGTGH